MTVRPERQERRRCAPGTGGTVNLPAHSKAVIRKRAQRKGAVKNCRIAISVDEGEHRELVSAALEEGITVSAFVADRALAAARRNLPVSTESLREALLYLNHANSQLRRAGINFNQAVAAFNSTGQAPGNILEYAQYTASVVQRVKEAARHVQERLP
jgi:hypothetical protein